MKTQGALKSRKLTLARETLRHAVLGPVTGADTGGTGCSLCAICTSDDCGSRTCSDCAVCVTDLC